MKRKVLTIRLALVVLIGSLLVVPLAGTAGANGPPTPEEVRAAIEEGVAWLAQQQNADGSWPHFEGNVPPCAVTALAVKKLEHHAVDPKWGLGLPSPFDNAYSYKGNVEKGLTWLFDNCAHIMPIEPQPAGDPDSDGDDIGVYFEFRRTYSTAIALMAICEAVELDRVVGSGPLAGWTYEQVARDTMDYLAFGQNDANWERGGWGYYDNQDPGWSDNSNTGYVALGLGFAEAAPPKGCRFTIPQFVKEELNIWIDYIQNKTGAGWYTDPLGGSGYTHPEQWVNILKTGNLLQQMALVGDTATGGRVQNALGYMCRHWYDPNPDQGWSGGRGGTASYQATFTAMKGFTSLGIHEICDPPIDWQADFETELLVEQNEDGSWPYTNWDRCQFPPGNPACPPILSTTWALLTLQKVAPPPNVPVDIKPQSCPNPLNVKAKGELSVAILGTDTFDVTQVDPASVQLEGVSPLHWDLEDVATPFGPPYVGKEDAFDCTEEGPDGYMDLTFKFDSQEVVAALGDVEDGDVLVLSLTGSLLGGEGFVGEDVVVIVKKWKE
jgi:hypothetical protein